MQRLRLVTALPIVGLVLFANGCKKSSESDGEIGADGAAGVGAASYDLKKTSDSPDSLGAYDLIIHLRSRDSTNRMISLKGHIQQIIVQTNIEGPLPIARGDGGTVITASPDSGAANDTSIAKIKIVKTPANKT